MTDFRKISIKKASFQDIEFLWYLRNDPEVVKNSKANRKVSWQEHIDWIMPILLGDKQKDLFLIEAGGVPAGQLRFDYDKTGRATVSISLAPQFRGKGIGQMAFRKAIVLLKKNKRVRAVLANVNKNNQPSIRFFERMGFKSDGKKRKWLEYILKINPGS